MSESVAEALGISPSLSFQGITYHLAERSLEMEGAVEVHLRRLAREAIQADREVMQPGEYEEHMRAWRAESPSLYAWDSYACRLFAQSTRGLKFLAFLQLKEGTPGEKVTPRLVEDWWKSPDGPDLAAAVVGSNFPFLKAALEKELQQMRDGAASTGNSSSPGSAANPGERVTPKSENSPADGSPKSSSGRVTSTAT